MYAIAQKQTSACTGIKFRALVLVKVYICDASKDPRREH
jgi:hypothetical protein